MINVPNFQMTVFDRRGVCVAATHITARQESVHTLVAWLKKDATRRLPLCGPFTVDVKNKKSRSMKTQIHELVSGKKSVIRNEKHSKYSNAQMTTDHFGFAGTNRKEREEIAGRVFAENGDTMHVSVRGVPLSLRRGASTTGKTEWFSAEITREQANAICGFPATAEWFSKCEGSWTFTINGDCTCVVDAYARRTPGSAWTHRQFYDIGEEFIAILE